MAWLFVAEFLFYVSGYIVQMTAGRFLGPEEYGRYALVVTVTLLVANLIGSGVPMAMSKFLSEMRAKNPEALGEVRKKSARAQLTVTAAVTVVFFALAPVFARALGDETLTPWFAAASLIIPCYAADSFYFYLFSGMRIFSVQSALKFVRAVLRIAVISALTYFFHLSGIFIGYLLVPIGVMIVAIVVDRRTALLESTREALPQFASRFSYKKIYALAFPITAFLVLFEILVSFDLYVLKYLFDNDALSGQYNAALTIARIPSCLFFALTLILLPSISELFAKTDFDRAKTVVSNAFRFMLIVGAPFVAASWAYPNTLTQIFFGREFMQAAQFLPFLATSMTIFAVLYVMAFAYNGAGKIKIPIALTAGLIAVNAALDFLVLRVSGPEAVPVVKFFVAIGLIPILLASIKKVFRVSIAFRDAGIIFLASGAVFAASRLGGDALMPLLLLALPLAAAYLAFLWKTGVIRKEDLAGLKRKRGK